MMQTSQSQQTMGLLDLIDRKPLLSISLSGFTSVSKEIGSNNLSFILMLYVGEISCFIFGF